jgi:uncharacterized protein YhjY with autotransporter beta-barrel domain
MKIIKDFNRYYIAGNEKNRTDIKMYSSQFRCGIRFFLDYKWILASLFGVTGIPADAQTLDEQMRRLLAQDSNNGVFCGELVGTSPRDTNSDSDTFLDPLNFGPQLASLCGRGGGVGQSSFTGAALSTVGQGDQVVKKRRLQAGKDKAANDLAGGGASADSELAIGSNINLFFNTDYRALDRRQTVFEQGYESNQKGLTLGADIMPTDWLVTGLAFNYSHWHGDQFDGGGFKTDSYGPTIFASLFPWEGFFADLSFQYSHKEGSNLNQRNYLREDNSNFGGAITGGPRANQYEGNVSTGYDYSIGSFTLGPRVTARYRHITTDSYTEQGNTGLELRFQEDSLTSIQTSVGAQASYAISTSWGVLVPQLNADWTREFANGQRSINVQFAQDNRVTPLTFGFQTDKPDRDFFHVGAGIVAILPHGIHAFANFETVRGHAYFDNYIGTVGLRLGL